MSPRKYTTAVRLLALAACATALHGAPVLERFESWRGFPEAVAGDVIDLIGSGLATEERSDTWWPLPSRLSATQVLLDGNPVPILSVSPSRVRIQLPWELAGLPGVQLVLERGGERSNPLNVWLSLSAPQIIDIDAKSIVPGQFFTLRAIGIGPRKKNPVTGEGATAQAQGNALNRLLVLIGDVPAPINWEFLAMGGPHSDGGVQLICVQVPSNVQTGDGVPVQLRIGDSTSVPYPLHVQPPATRILLSPIVAQVPLGGHHTFVASVEGSGDQSLTWTLDANAYNLPNNSGYYGSISNKGVFSANYNMPVPSWVVARAMHSSGAFATALIQLVSGAGKAYRIVPETPVIVPGESVTFTLLGQQGETVDGVSWRISDSFSSETSPTYTAPLNYAPERVNVWASLPGQYGSLYHVASTSIIISPPRAKITGVSPSAVNIGEAITFHGIGLNARNVTAWFSGADGTHVRATGQFGTGDGIVVPRGAVSGPVYLELSSGDGSSTYTSAPYNLTVLPRLRLRASRLRVSSGESVQILAAAPDVPGTWKPAWRSDLGTIDANGVFVAPAVDGATYARIWACLLGNSECSTTIVQIVPIRLDPDPLIISPGDTVQLKALRGTSEVAVSWEAATANITVTRSGKLTAGTGPFDGGVAKVLAYYGNLILPFEISIRAPGTVAHASEFHDWIGYDNNSPNGRMALGTFPMQVAVNGNWIYAASRSLQFPGYIGPWLATWIDVYQLDENKNPVWVDAVEGPTNCVDLYVVGNELYAAGSDSSHILLRYDVSAGRPALRSRQFFTGEFYWSDVKGGSVTVQKSWDLSVPVTLKLLDGSSGEMRTLSTDYLPIADYTGSGSATTGWAAVQIQYPFASGPGAEIVIFDTTGPSAVTLAIFPTRGPGQAIAILQDILVVGRDVYRISGGQVTPVGELPGQYIVDFDPITKRVLMTAWYSIQEAGYLVVDLSDVEDLKISASVVHPDQSAHGGLGPDYFVLTGGGQNVAVYPILWQRGIRKTDSFPATPWMNDVRARDGYVYWTGPGWGYTGRSHSFGIFEVNDVSSEPAQVVATMDRPGDQVGWAIELNGRYAYVGTDHELIVYDISAPTRPLQTFVVPAPAYSLALAGRYLYVGSNAGSAKALLVYDVSNPAEPRLVSSLPLPEFAYGISAGKGWLAVALGYSGYSVYSLASPATPVKLVQHYGTTWDVAANGDLLYTASGDSGLIIYSLFSPQNPTFVSITPLGVGTEMRGEGFPSAMAVSYDDRGIVWVSSEREGRVYGLDVREPLNPRHVAEVMTGRGTLVYPAIAAEVSNGRLYVAGNNAAFDVAAPQNVGLYGAAQPAPGQIVPDRFGDTRPASAEVVPSFSESIKSRILNGREPAAQPAPDARKP